MVDPSALKSHLDDYAEVFERTSDRFVCPITLRECEESELINGHILNCALLDASRRQVIQYDKVDHFYGTRVEPELVRYLNMKERSMADMVRANRNMFVTFDDGTNARAFVASRKAAKSAKRRFPTIDAHIGDESVLVFVMVDFDDPRLNSPINLSGSEPAFPSHWVAAMLKASVLTMFDMIGYRAILNPLGDTLRRTLANYYRDNATRADAATYFRHFHNSVKLLGKGRAPSDLRTNYIPFEFDSLEDRMVLLHYAGSDQNLMFAATYVFKVNGATVTSTIPQSLGGSDVAVVWRLYQKMLAVDKPSGQRVYRAQFKDNLWKVETTPLDVHYVDGPDVFDKPD